MNYIMCRILPAVQWRSNKILSIWLYFSSLIIFRLHTSDKNIKRLFSDFICKLLHVYRRICCYFESGSISIIQSITYKCWMMNSLWIHQIHYSNFKKGYKRNGISVCLFLKTIFKFFGKRKKQIRKKIKIKKNRPWA